MNHQQRESILNNYAEGNTYKSICDRLREEEEENELKEHMVDDVGFAEFVRKDKTGRTQQQLWEDYQRKEEEQNEDCHSDD